MTKLIGSPPRPAGEFDVPLADVQAQIAAQPLREAIAHEAELGDDYEVSALSEALVLVTHPDIAVSTDDDYADGPWPAYIAAQIAKSNQTRRTR